MNNLAITLIGATAGAILSYALPYLVRAKRNREQADLVGSWKSAYLFEDSGTWVSEEVRIALRGTRFTIESTNNPIGDFYQATATYSEGELRGRWESKSGGARGGFNLIVSAHGDVLYGYFTGPRETGERVFSAWVLAQADDGVQRGARLLHTQTLPLPAGD